MTSSFAKPDARTTPRTIACYTVHQPTAAMTYCVLACNWVQPAKLCAIVSQSVCHFQTKHNPTSEHNSNRYSTTNFATPHNDEKKKKTRPEGDYTTPERSRSSRSPNHEAGLTGCDKPAETAGCPCRRHIVTSSSGSGNHSDGCRHRSQGSCTPSTSSSTGGSYTTSNDTSCLRSGTHSVGCHNNTCSRCTSRTGS